MKKWKIKYQKGNDILVQVIEAVTQKLAQWIFYMEDSQRDIISIEEVKDEAESQYSRVLQEVSLPVQIEVY